MCVTVLDKFNALYCPELVSDIESIWIKIHCKESVSPTTYVCSFYRPPARPSTYVESFKAAVNKVTCKHKNKALPHVVIAGDFNFPEIDWFNQAVGYSRGGQVLLDFAFDNFLSQLVLEPTQLGNTSANILDLVFSTQPALVQNMCVGSLFSDHSYISFNIMNSYPPKSKPSHKIFLFNRADIAGMKADLLLSSEKYLKEAVKNTVEQTWLQLKLLINTAIDKYVPCKINSSDKVRSPPWISNKIKQLIKIRDHLSMVALKTGRPNDRTLFKAARTKTKKAVSLAYNAYISSLLGDIHSAPQKFYKVINSKRTENQDIPSLKTIMS